MHADDRCINTKSSSTQGGKEVHDIKGVEEELLAVATHPSLDATVDTVGDLAGDRIEVLFGQDRISLTVVANDKDGRECVAELQDASCANESCKIGDLWNGTSDDEGECPVDRDCISISRCFFRQKYRYLPRATQVHFPTLLSSGGKRKTSRRTDA